MQPDVVLLYLRWLWPRKHGGANYIVGSCMYGSVYWATSCRRLPSAELGTWTFGPSRMATQREQLEDLGEDRFRALLDKHDVRLCCITQYKLGPFGLKDEMRVAQRLGCGTIVTGGEGPVGLKGSELKQAVGQFIEKLKPHLQWLKIQA